MPSKHFCPKCSSKPKIEINNNLIEIQINCKCGYNNTLSIEEYFNKIKSIKPVKVFEIERAKEYIHFYFSFLKTNAIKASKQNEAQIKSSYKKSYQKNIKILSLLSIIKVGYPRIRYQINIYQYNDDIKKVDDVINYYDTYQIVSFQNNKGFNILQFKPKTLKKFCDSDISCLFLLKDSRIAVGTKRGEIFIINARNNFKVEIKKKGHVKEILGFGQLKNNDLVSASEDGPMKIWSINETQLILLLTIKNEFESILASMIEISNDRMVSIGGRDPIKIWDIKRPYKIKKIKEIEDVCWWNVCLFYIEEKEMLFSGSDLLYIWDTKNFDIITTFTIGVCWTNSICRIDKSRIIVGGKISLTIINFDKIMIEYYVIIPESDFSSFIPRNDGNIICSRISGNEKIGVFNLYSKRFELIPPSKLALEDIYYMVQIDENKFVTTRAFNYLTIWSY